MGVAVGLGVLVAVGITLVSSAPTAACTVASMSGVAVVVGVGVGVGVAGMPQAKANNKKTDARAASRFMAPPFVATALTDGIVAQARCF